MRSLSRDDPQAGSQLPMRPLELQQPRLDAGQLRGLAIGGAIVLGLMLWLFWHFFARQFRIAIHHQADWGHTLVIPLIAGYFVFLNRHRLLATGFKTTWVGLIPMVLGTAWYMFCWLGPITLRHHNLQGAGLSLTLFGIVLLFFGFRATSYLLFPLLYLCVFGQGVSDRLMNYVTFPLQDITARGSFVFLYLIDLDIERRGNILTIYDDGVAKPLNVAEACSGMRMLVAQRDRAEPAEHVPRRFKTTWVGLIPMVLGTAWYMFCWLGPITLRHHNLQGAGLSLTLFGIVLLFFGFRATSYLLFPLLYLCVFGQGVSDRLMNYVTFPLQDITARGSFVFLYLIDLDIERRGNILTIYDDGVAKPLNVAEACSGMRMLVAFLALGVAMAYTGFKHFWQRVILVLMGVPIAIFVNILRVATLAMLSLVDSNFTAGDFHTFIGLLWLVPALLIYLGMIWILRHLIIEEETSGSGRQLAAAAPPNVPMRSES